MAERDWTVVLHGGAGWIFDHAVLPQIESAMEQALDASFAAIATAKDGLDVVVAGLAVLEMSEYFDCGYGGFPRNDGRVQLDISLVDGSGRFYAIAGVERVVHPSRLALHLLRSSERSMFRYRDEGFEAKVAALSSELKEYIGYRERAEDMVAPFAEHCLKVAAERSRAIEHGTVGCVVRSPDGQLFAGTSTGATPDAPLGRVGDSPLVGVGSFADNDIAALSATGLGEAFIASSTLAFSAFEIQRHAPENEQALRLILDAARQRTQSRHPGADVGIIALTAKGISASLHTTEMMPCAWGRGAQRPEVKKVSNFGLVD